MSTWVNEMHFQAKSLALLADKKTLVLGRLERSVQNAWCAMKINSVVRLMIKEYLVVQSSAVITRSSIVRYYIDDYRN